VDSHACHKLSKQIAEVLGSAKDRARSLGDLLGRVHHLELTSMRGKKSRYFDYRKSVRQVAVRGRRYLMP